jgi:SAM-dependent methyltransferase
MDRVVDAGDPPDMLAAYDAIAPHYAEYSRKYAAYLDSVDRLVIGRLRPGLRLLDVGSGDGRRLKKICDHHGLKDVVSVEPSGEMAALCRKTTGFSVHPLFGDALDRLQEAPFDAITALWNVFGHMAGTTARLKSLTQMAGLLKPDGVVLLDVNNRHNSLAYGRWTVLKRRIVDFLGFDERRGDARFDWKIGEQVFPAAGHLFTPREIEGLFARAGLAVAERCSVHYATGEVSASPRRGQLFYRLRKT